MSKRNTTGTGSSRKRRKGRISHSTRDLDALVAAPEKVEDVRVWNMTVSETTGRVSGTRKTHQYIYQSPPVPLCEEPPVVGAIDASADPEPTEPPPAKSTGRRKRVRIVKENDSVGSILIALIKLTIAHW